MDISYVDVDKICAARTTLMWTWTEKENHRNNFQSIHSRELKSYIWSIGMFKKMHTNIWTDWPEVTWWQYNWECKPSILNKAFIFQHLSHKQIKIMTMKLHVFIIIIVAMPFTMKKCKHKVIIKHIDFILHVHIRHVHGPRLVEWPPVCSTAGPRILSSNSSSCVPVC